MFHRIAKPVAVVALLALASGGLAACAETQMSESDRMLMEDVRDAANQATAAAERAEAAAARAEAAANDAQQAAEAADRAFSRSMRK
jgi:hypothetical protein